VLLLLEFGGLEEDLEQARQLGILLEGFKKEEY
jgi:hypothetical protein